MYPFRKVRNIVRGLIQRHGTASAKKQLWDREFSRGQWRCLDRLEDDGVFRCAEKYARNGSILDLGCGPGSTVVELNPSAYHDYTGVDISEVAIEKAKARIAESDRAGRVEYLQGDILNYIPKRQYDVVLYGDSIYYIPQRQIPAMLARYSGWLKSGGVFIVRIFDVRGKHQAIVEMIESGFEIAEKRIDPKTQAAVIAFRPLAQARAANP